jgi:hypothetical protein
VKRISWLAYLLVILILLGTALLLIAHGSTISANAGAGNSKQTSAQSLPTPPPSCHYCSTRFLNASLDEIGQFAVQRAIDWHEASGAPPQAVLTRMVTPQDYLPLGLGCPLDFGTIEVPPLALVILKGDLRPNMPDMGAEPPGIKYIGYVFDLWADAPTLEIASRDGGAFRIALNDPSLPSDETDTYICPTPVPYKKTLHYGDSAPGFLVPPTLPPAMQGSIKPTPTTPIISSTPIAPAPVQTLEDVQVPPPPVSTQEATARPTAAYRIDK